MRIIRTAATLLMLGLAGCDGILEVSNPRSLPEERFSDPALEQFVVNGAVGEFQVAYGTYVLWSGALADEVFTDHTNTNFRDLSLHEFTDLNTSNDEVYGNLQRARRSADDAVKRLRATLGAGADSSPNVARALVYGGYAYVLLGEGFCEAPVDLGAPLPSAELLARGIARFEQAITVATAVATAAKNAATAAAAQDLIHLAQVGAARASLKRGDHAKARTYAAAVPEAYERWVYYSANSTPENNPLQFFVRASLPSLGMQPAFQGLDDVRVPQPSSPRTSQASHLIFPPLKPSMYSGWTGVGAGESIEVGTHIRFASGLEARYVMVEADGPTAAMLTFVNARRRIAGKPPVSISGATLVAEFRRQRALDFYLTGQRLGDLRRYAAAGADLFPIGKFPVLPDSYGTMHCFIVPRSEKAGNPNT